MRRSAQATETQGRKGLKGRKAPKGKPDRKSLAAKEPNIARVTRERDSLLQQQSAASEVLKVISAAAGDLEPVFQSVLENAVRICDAKFGTLFRCDGNSFHFAAGVGTPARLADFERKRGAFQPPSGTLVDRVRATKQVQHSADYSAEPVPGASARLGGARSTVCIPMLKGDTLIGVFLIYRQEVRPFTNDNIKLLQNFAAQAVIAIENARLLNELRQRTDDLSEALEQQTATSEVLGVISSSPGELKPVFESMLENAVRICEANFGTMFRNENGVFHPAAVNAEKEFAEFVWRRGSFQPPPRTPLDRLLRTREVICTADEAAEPNPGSPGRLAGARSLVAVPMLKEKELIGAIVLYRMEVRPFTKKQIELVSNFAKQAVIAIENTRLLNELRESLQQQTATSEVLSVISSSPGDLKPVFEAILANATRICDAKFGILALSEGDAFRTAALHGAPPAFAEARAPGTVIRPGPGTGFHRAATTRQPVQIADIRAEPAYTNSPQRYAVLDLAGARTLLAVPMLKEGKLVGMIDIYRQEVRPFTDKQIELLKNFAAQAVIAVENTRLLNELRQRTDDLSESLEQQTATSEVLQVISSSPGELEPVFQAMLENAVRICAARFGSLVLFEGDKYRRVALHNAPAVFVEAQAREPVRLLAASPTLSRLAETRQTISYADILAEQPEEAIGRLGGARTVLAVPMLKDDRAVGAISIYRQEVRPFTEKQMEVLRNFAAQAVIAIENTRLLNELRESLQQQTATADVLKVISRSTFDLQVVLDTLVESAARLCRAEKSAIRLVKENLYHHVASYGFSREFEERMQHEPLKPGRGSIVGRVVLDGHSIHLVDAQADPDSELANRSRSGNVRTVLGVPLLREGTPIGVLLLQRSVVQPFTDKEIELAETFADQAVIAIENVRLFDEVQARTRELSEALEQQTATSEVLRVISSSPGTLEPVFQIMLENATRLCEAQYGVLFLWEGDGRYRVGALHGASPRLAEERRPGTIIRPAPSTVITRIAETKRTAQENDIQANAAYVNPPPGYMAAGIALHGGARTELGVPMLKDGKLIGALVIYRREVRPFTDKQTALLANFAAQAVIAIENARLLNELRESLQQQTATSEVLKVISSTPGELEPVFNAMLANATHICEAKLGHLFLREGYIFRAVAIYSRESHVDLRRNPAMDVRDNPGTPIDLLFKTKEVVHIPDLKTDQSYIGRNNRIVPLVEIGGARTFVTVPMLKDDELVGAISMYRQEVRPFTEKQIELVKNFAAQAVIAIENTRLLNELRESLQQQTATADVLKVISRSTFDLQTVLQTLVESAAKLCNADKGNITREKDGVFYRAAASYGYSRQFMDHIKGIPLKPDRGSATGRALLEGRTVHIPDVTTDPEYTLAEAQRLGDYRTILCVPMLREGVALGVLTLTRSEVRPFSDKQIELVTTFADQAAIAIENVRLFESVEARTRELADSLEDLRTTQDRLVQTQKLASLGQLTAGIAHEIKNPLNFVNNFSGISAELIDELQDTLKHPLDDKARAEIKELTDTLKGNLDKIVQHGKRADAIVKNMLLHSREGSGEHRSVDINALVEESLNLAYHGARAEKQGFTITLERSLDPAAGQADVFPQDITRVLLNLILNGFYAATKRREADNESYEPTLIASTRSLGDRVEIRVRDNGTGILPEVKEKMFNPFFTTKPAGEGTGLGLSISHDIIVKQHGGLIEVETEPGEYTEFRIVLPRTAAFVTTSGGQS